MNELQIAHWYNGLPKDTKATITGWESMTHEERVAFYNEPSKAFRDADKKFYEESNVHNH